MGSKSGKNFVFIIFILCGVVIGGLLGNFLGGLPYMSFLKFGETFGTTSPLALDLGIIAISLGVNITINVAGIIGIAIAIFLYRKL